ncbi:hypothetical protein CN984_11880 [Bacillus cereus]|uniref:Uncharacterized protein n=1 Tax=Bacillus cereus TaxID=1396 RepID=A0A2B9Q2X2_BACCE|nr:hypothetical protein [Bacillus cereus]PEA25876.1 hypothetical protein CON44_18215 [Bacillus cereus]PGO29144.1 hypothetical protein CN984_11880 [Bacillus cereus]
MGTGVTNREPVFIDMETGTPITKGIETIQISDWEGDISSFLRNEAYYHGSLTFESMTYEKSLNSYLSQGIEARMHHEFLSRQYNQKLN